MTEEQKQFYLKCKGSLCPYCRSNNFHYCERKFDLSKVWRGVYCENCHEYWQEEYTLTDIIE